MVKYLGFGLFAARLEQRRRAVNLADAPIEIRDNGMRAVFSIFPLLVFPVVFYNLVAFGFTDGGDVTSVAGNTVAPATAWLDAVWIGVPMIASVTWEITGGDIIIIISMALLFMEILKSTSTGTATIINHAVSMILFIVCLVEFLLFQNFSTSVFFILTAMTLLDVLAGVVVTIVSARRDFAVGEGFTG